MTGRLKERLSRLRGSVSAVAQLVREERGATIPIIAASMVPVIGAVGGGVDITRVYLAETQLQSAVDAATLAAARTLRLQTDGQNTIEEGTPSYQAAHEYFEANFPQGYLGTTLAPLAITGERNADGVEVKVVATATIPSTFASIFGVEAFTIEATSEATSANTPSTVEAMLVLDNTGSMAGQRILDLKAAATEFVDVLYGDNSTRQGVAIGMLPYNVTVNVGSAFPTGMVHNYIQSYTDFTDRPADDPRSWKGCVFADRTIHNLSSDINHIDTGAEDLGKNLPGDPGFTNLIEPFYYPPIYVNSFQKVNNFFKIAETDVRANALIARMPALRDAITRHFYEEGDGIGSSDPDEDDKNKDGRMDIYNDGWFIERLIAYDPSGDQKRPAYKDWPAPKFYEFRSTVTGVKSLWGPSPNYQCPSPAMPVQYGRTKAELLDYIEDENTALMPGTGTYHNIAMTWAYRLLVRNDVFPRTNDTQKPPKRVIIFMTDGNFDSRDDGRKQYNPTTKKNDLTRFDTSYTAYRTYEDRTLGSSDKQSDVIPALSLRFAKTCQAAKADGVEIYTIAFALGSTGDGPKTKEMFKTCSSNPATHFFDAATGQQLKDAFRSIGNDLVDLHLSQ
jgi:Flp pilus assembly protein TadG